MAVQCTAQFKKGALLLTLFLGTWIFVPAARASDVTLKWDPPTTNVDETPLVDLAGYKLYYGTSAGSYNTVIDVGNVATTAIPNLDEGIIYYFAVTAYDDLGNESGFSNEVNKVILATPPGNIDVYTPASATRVDGYDLIALELSWGSTLLDTNWNPLSDLDNNGFIDQSDLNILIGNFGIKK